MNKECKKNNSLLARPHAVQVHPKQLGKLEQFWLITQDEKRLEVWKVNYKPNYLKKKSLRGLSYVFSRFEKCQGKWQAVFFDFRGKPPLPPLENFVEDLPVMDME